MIFFYLRLVANRDTAIRSSMRTTASSKRRRIIVGGVGDSSLCYWCSTKTCVGISNTLAVSCWKRQAEDYSDAPEEDPWRPPWLTYKMWGGGGGGGG